MDIFPDFGYMRVNIHSFSTKKCSCYNIMIILRLVCTTVTAHLDNNNIMFYNTCQQLVFFVNINFINTAEPILLEKDCEK